MNPGTEIVSTLQRVLALGVAAFAVIMLLVFSSTVLGTLLGDWRDRRRHRRLLIRRFPGGHV